MAKFQTLNMDAFSDGQMASKIWLCENLESQHGGNDPLEQAWIYGSWYGLLAFLLLSRNRISVKNFHLFDIDSQALETSRAILDHWKFSKETQIHFHLHDCSRPKSDLPQPQLVINTSSEHFPDFSWWKNLHGQFLYVIQSTNMAHPEHLCAVSGLSELKSQLEATDVLFEGTKEFHYPRLQFQRFMVIGRR